MWGLGPVWTVLAQSFHGQRYLLLFVGNGCVEQSCDYHVHLEQVCECVYMAAVYNAPLPAVPCRAIPSRPVPTPPSLLNSLPARHLQSSALVPQLLPCACIFIWGGAVLGSCVLLWKNSSYAWDRQDRQMEAGNRLVRFLLL